VPELDQFETQREKTGTDKNQKMNLKLKENKMKTVQKELE
jgi:hypothetical protein